MAVSEPTLPVRMSSYPRGRRLLRRQMGRSNPLYEFLEPYAVLDTVRVDDDFLGLTLNAGLWTVAGTNGTDFAHVIGVNGIVQADRGATNNDYNSLCGELQWYGDQRCVLMASIRTELVTNAKIEVGFTDVGSDTTGAATVDQTYTTTPTMTADDCAIVAFDSTGGASLWFLTNGTSMTAQGTDTGVDAANNVWYDVVIALDEQNTARCWVNNQLRATHVNAVEGGTALLPWVVTTEIGASGTPTCDLDYLFIWEERA